MGLCWAAAAGGRRGSNDKEWGPGGHPAPRHPLSRCLRLCKGRPVCVCCVASLLAWILKRVLEIAPGGGALTVVLVESQ